jgi:hypothetical protein
MAATSNGLKLDKVLVLHFECLSSLSATRLVYIREGKSGQIY